MRAGQLTRRITVERRAETIDRAGTPEETWTPLAFVRAEVIQASTDEFIRSAGAEAVASAVFRIRFVEGITVADRISYAGQTWNVVEMKELGRRRGLELRAVARAP